MRQSFLHLGGGGGGGFRDRVMPQDEARYQKDIVCARGYLTKVY